MFADQSGESRIGDCKREKQPIRCSSKGESDRDTDRGGKAVELAHQAGYRTIMSHRSGRRGYYDCRSGSGIPYRTDQDRGTVPFERVAKCNQLRTRVEGSCRTM